MRIVDNFLSALFIPVLLFLIFDAAQAETLPGVYYQVMTHMDQEQPDPLQGSLQARIGNIEVDVFLDNRSGEILVGHDIDDLDPRKTLEALYLQPLKKLIEAKGQIFSGGLPLNLFVYVKSDASKAYLALDRILKLGGYKDIVTRIEEGQVFSSHINIVITGNRDWDRVRSSEPRYVSLDGRLSDLGQHFPPDLVPMISDNWKTLFPAWRSGEPLSSRQRQILKGLIDDAALNGQYLRFWATPEDPGLWEQLLNLGGQTIVINTDTPRKLVRFIEDWNNPKDPLNLIMTVREWVRFR